jgi:hypothetical protein
VLREVEVLLLLKAEALLYREVEVLQEVGAQTEKNTANLEVANEAILEDTAMVHICFNLIITFRTFTRTTKFTRFCVPIA